MKTSLSPHYGSEIFEGTERWLVLRVPGPDADVVNDLERAVEHLDPEELTGIQQILLIGSDRSTVISPAPLHDLMAERLAMDARVGPELRQALRNDLHVLHRSVSDPRRVVRLGVRIPREHARDVEDDDLAAVADDLGPRLAHVNYQQVRAVHLIAQKDIVRIDADLFMQEMHRRWASEAKKREAEAAEHAKAIEEKRAKEAERLAVLDRLQDRMKAPVAVAPLRRLEPSSWEADPGRVTAARTTSPTAGTETSAAPIGQAPPEAVDGLHARVDRLVAPWRLRNNLDGRPAETRVPSGLDVSTIEPRPVFGKVPPRPTGAPGRSGDATRAFRPTSAASTDPRDQTGREIDAAIGRTRGAGASTGLAMRGQAPGEPDGLDAHALMAAEQVTRSPPRTAPATTPVVVPAPEPAGLAQLVTALERAGYEVLRSPPTPVPLAAAAERDDYPARVIVQTPERFDMAAAEAALDAAARLDAEMALVLAPKADPDARKRIIATRVKWVDPEQIDAVGL